MTEKEAKVESCKLDVKCEESRVREAQHDLTEGQKDGSEPKRYKIILLESNNLPLCPVRIMECFNTIHLEGNWKQTSIGVMAATEWVTNKEYRMIGGTESTFYGHNQWGINGCFVTNN